MIIISAHSDTNFKNVNLKIDGDSYVGSLNNYAGVSAAMKPYFSGEMNHDFVRIELAYDEDVRFSVRKNSLKSFQKMTL